MTTKNRNKTDGQQARKSDLTTKRAAILVADGFEQSEMTHPRDALRDAGVQVDIVSPNEEEVRGWQGGDWGDSFPVDVRLEQADPERYDALVLPGGVINPDKLRVNEQALDFIRRFFEKGRTVAAICHGPWSLIDAGVARGRRMTSYHSIRADLQNAGVRWEDSEVVVDQGLVTSRSPEDLEAFSAKLLEEIAEGVHELQKTGA